MKTTCEMKCVKRGRRGFTLVELLIVIIIIGILAGAMLLVAGSGTDSAEATKIISDLRSMKSASLLFYADNPDQTDAPAITALEKYMEFKPDTAYTTAGDADTGWWVGRTGMTAAGVQGKLADKAQETSLFNKADATSADVYTGGEQIWMKAR